MAGRDEVRALEALTPWDRPAFRAGLTALSACVRSASQAYAADVWALSQLAAQVPRCAHDESGATPWTSFRHEVAVARQTSGQAAAADLRIAVRLTSVLPHTLHLLEAGRITVTRARVFVTELEVLDDELAGQLDCDLADVVARLAPWRIKDEVRRAALALDPDTAAVRKAAATAARDVTMEPMSDGQACVTMIGPAVPLIRWYATLDARARALRQAGDPRNLAALRFDLATSTFPCLSHLPADQTDPQAQAPALFGPSARPAGSGGATWATGGTSAHLAGSGGSGGSGSGGSRSGGCNGSGASGGPAAPAPAPDPSRLGVSAGSRLAGVEAASADSG